jgi:MFS family permease
MKSSLIKVGLMRFSEPISMTSVFPYLPSMIAGFDGVKPADVGFWSGLAGAIFSAAQCLTAIKWGQLSDKYGRKPIMLLGLVNTMIASLLFGLSTNLPLALLSRALIGAVNGNAGILRTAVAEICPWKVIIYVT